MELSLVKTSRAKFKTTCQKIYKRYSATIYTKDGTYKVLQVKVERDSKKLLITYFGGVTLRWNKWVEIDGNQTNQIWNSLIVMGTGKFLFSQICCLMSLLCC